MKFFLNFFILSVLLVSGCAGGPDPVDNPDESESTEVVAIESAEAPEASDLETLVPDAVVEPSEPTAPSSSPEPAEEATDMAAETEDAKDNGEEPEEAEEPEEIEEVVEEAPAPVLPEISDISFRCRTSYLTVEVHAKIPGTKGSEGRYYWGISAITAYRKNEYNAELSHKLKWDGAYDPAKDKWISAERTIAGEKDDVRIFVEGQDANGNKVSMSKTFPHGTGC